MSMFCNYTVKDPAMLPPDNIHGFLKQKPEYDQLIVLGNDTCHTYIVSHPLAEISNVKLIYSQGTETILRAELSSLKNNSTLTCEYAGSEDDPESILAMHIPSIDTLLFNDYNKDVKSQLHITLVDGSREVSDIYNIKLIPMVKDKSVEDFDNE